MQAPEGFSACSSEGLGNLMETGSYQHSLYVLINIDKDAW